MAFRILSNLIKSPAVHQEGEIVDLDAETAANLTRRGLVQEVADAATHIFGQTNEGYAAGGKPVDGAPAAAPAVPAPQALDPTAVPEINTTHADAIGDAKDQHGAPITAPANTQQPSAEEVAATAAQEN